MCDKVLVRHRIQILTFTADVATVLADATEEDIKNFQNDLRKIKNRTSTDLQHNVFQNRSQFIKISKEAEKLKGEMNTLRKLMTELTDALGQATSSTASGGRAAGLMGASEATAARKQANRSSVANLEVLWNSHLHTLWKRVEGSQKFLPAVPGRHIVYESGRWLELNAATWKARRRVHLILLNDHLLIASEKKRNHPEGQSPSENGQRPVGQLVAQRCWPLQDVHISDIAPQKPSGSSAINIRVGPESWTFATGAEEGGEKSTLLSNFRKATEDLRKTEEAETEEREKARNSVEYFATRDMALLKKPELMNGLETQNAASASSVVIDVDGKQQNIRWIEAQLDDLDIDIALQSFEDAVARVEKLRLIAKTIRGNEMARDIVKLKVDQRAAKLATVITKYLADTHSWQQTTSRHVDWLTRMGFADRARESYLEARGQMIKRRTR